MFKNDSVYDAVWDALEKGHKIDEILRELGAEAARAEEDYNKFVEENLSEAREDLVNEMVNYVSLLTGKPVTKEEVNVLSKILQDMEKKPVKTKEKKNDDDEVIKAFVRLFG